MAEKTGIAWTRSTFNPWIGCTKVSPGCDHCYAEALDKRHRWGGKVHWGVGMPRHRTTPHLWNQPRAWNRKAAETGERWLVFCASLADVFDNEVPKEWRADLFALIHDTPALTWLLLTKRIGNAAKMMAEAADHPWPLPLPNVWIGASMVNQEEADRDIPKLLDTPAVKRFVSYEPALGPINWRGTSYGPDWLEGWYVEPRCCGRFVEGHHPDSPPECCAEPEPEQCPMPKVDWIIFGGESNQGKHLARPCSLEWARSTRDQCRDTGAAFFMKQTGSDHALLYERVQKDRAGADPAEWPEDLRVQEFPA